MTQVPAALVAFARRLILHEAGEGRRTQDLAGAFERGCLALHGRFSPLISSAGCDALIARAVRLAAQDFAFLAAADPPIGANCATDRLRQAVDGREPKEVEDVVVTILASFIWLLIIFIGENLGLRKIREVWPEVPSTSPGSLSEKAPQ